MRLLHAQTIQLEEFFDSNIPPYAILSHVWGKPNEEITFDDVKGSAAVMAAKKGYRKLRNCCRQALRDELKWVWIDTCCINKSSSAELSEAINSMYQWYQNAMVCYVYLEDVDVRAWTFERSDRSLWASKWFTRGWTLQELIAPSAVEFYDRKWKLIGSKWSLLAILQDKTHIRGNILVGDAPMCVCSVAERMGWAAERVTTKVEDMAYCMLGIFGVTMPMLYGEGSRAFLRLQEEILRQQEDYTLLAWGSLNTADTWKTAGIMATSPSNFGSRFLFSYLGSLGKRTLVHGWYQWPDVESITSMGMGLKDFARERGLNSFEPPTVTSRGLKIGLLARETEDGELLVWTCCVPTIGRSFIVMSLSKAEPHWRSPRPLQCLPWEDLADFEPKEFYLPVEGRDQVQLSSSSRFRVSYDPSTRLKVLLSVKMPEGRNLSSTAQDLECDFTSDGESKAVENAAFLQCFDFWPKSFGITTTESGVELFLERDANSDYVPCTKAVLSFRYAMDGAEGEFCVFLGTYRSQPWCNIVAGARLQRHPLNERFDRWQKVFADPKALRWLSDRSRSPVDGRRIWIEAMIKRQWQCMLLNVSVIREFYGYLF
ncbi:heterokaryon incompatibility protein-domain-containing protein [Xylariaceae sp. FL0662B]|nr:heterokaryon incompatibility protein-domain-containing protein [Xylariaceae sp. FL0662B]